MRQPILSVGISAMMLQIMFFVQQAVVFRSIAHYGSDWHIAFMGACYRITVLIILPTFGFAQAMQPVAGINFGAKAFDRVKATFKIFTKGSSTLLVIIWLFLMAFPEMVLRWMLPEATFSTTDIFNYRMMMVSLPVFPFFFMSNTLFQAIGAAKTAGYMLVAREIALFVPIVLILPYIYGVNGIYHAIVPVNTLVFFNHYLFDLETIPAMERPWPSCHTLTG